MVAAVAWVRPMAQELSYEAGTAKTKPTSHLSPAKTRLREDTVCGGTAVQAQGHGLTSHALWQCG